MHGCCLDFDIFFFDSFYLKTEKLHMQISICFLRRLTIWIRFHKKIIKYSKFVVSKRKKLNNLKVVGKNKTEKKKPSENCW